MIRDIEGWYSYEHKYRSSVSNALFLTTSEIIDLFPKIRHKIYAKLLEQRNNKPFGLHLRLIIFIRELAESDKQVNETAGLNDALIAIWTIEFTETSNLVWLVVAVDKNGQQLKIHDMTAYPEELIKKMVNNIINFQFSSRLTSPQEITSKKARNQNLSAPFKIVIKMDQDWQPCENMSNHLFLLKQK